MNCNCNLDNFELDFATINLNCEMTWDTICDGNTKGVFQLDSQLGKMLSKKLMPRNIEELAALTALMRPSCLEGMHEGKSICEHYIDRKHGREDNVCPYPGLEDILDETYFQMVYQENCINISKKIAGFSLQEADVLRKSVGKKKPELMAKVKKDFLQGCKKTGIVNEEQAKDIFSWIEASQRYSFNKSHAVAYGLNSYMSAYLKSHFPNEFFTSYLYYAKNKQDPQTEMRELINDAKLNNVVVNKPNINIKNKNFSLVDNIIYFGLQDVKGIGSSTYDGLIKVLSEKEQQLDKKILYWTWIDFLIFLSPYIKKTIVEGLIYSGALDHMNIDRLRMEFEYDKYMTLSNRERKYIEENIENPKDIKEILNTIIDLGSGKKFACYNKNRLSHCKELLKIIENRPLDIGTNIGVLASKEEYYLGLFL